MKTEESFHPPKNLDEMHEQTFKTFIELISSQDKIVLAEDLLPEWLYVHITSPDKINIGRAILWRGNDLLHPKCDAQLNLEYSIGGSTYVEVRAHMHQSEDKTEINKLSDPSSWIKGD
jgi:hypothetical protein